MKILTTDQGTHQSSEKDIVLYRTTIQTPIVYTEGGSVGWSVGPASGRLGVRIPAATDSSSLKQVVTVSLLNARQ